MGVEALRVALGALVGHRFRTVLTMLSIVIGAFAIVLMVSLAQSGLATLQHGMEELGGSRVILIGSRPSEKQVGKQGTYPTGFTLHEYQSLTRAVPHLTEHTIFYVGRDYVDAQSDTGAVARTDLVAGDSHFFDAFRLPVAEGRGIGDADDKGHAPVCVVSPKVAEALFRGSPVGHMLTVGTVRCRVVGRLAKVERWGVGFGWDWDDLVVVPLETVADAVPEVHSSATLFFKTDDKANNDAVKRILHARLGDLHHGLDDYLIFDFAKGLARFESMFLLMQALVGVVSGIALLVGGVGVMNMLLVSVTERVGEIGVRKALGARPSDIGLQFFLEAVLLAGLGGVTGALLGLGAAEGAFSLLRRVATSWQGQLSFGAALAAVLVSVLIGASFGYVPARRAARLDPVTCMRR